MEEQPPELDPAQNVLNRMRRNYALNRGIKISAQELASLALTFLAELWDQPDPRRKGESHRKG